MECWSFWLFWSVLLSFPLLPVLPAPDLLIRFQYKQYKKIVVQNWGCMGRYHSLQTLKQFALGHLTFMPNHCVVISFTCSLISQHLLNNGFGSRRYSLCVCVWFLWADNVTRGLLRKPSRERQTLFFYLTSGHTSIVCIVCLFLATSSDVCLPETYLT